MELYTHAGTDAVLSSSSLVFIETTTMHSYKRSIMFLPCFLKSVRNVCLLVKKRFRMFRNISNIRTIRDGYDCKDRIKDCKWNLFGVISASLVAVDGERWEILSFRLKSRGEFFTDCNCVGFYSREKWTENVCQTAPESISMSSFTLLSHTYHLFTSLACDNSVLIHIVTKIILCTLWGFVWTEDWSWQCHLAYVWMWFPHCGQEWCASCRPRTMNGIRQKPQTNPITARRKHMHQAAFPGRYVTLVVTTCWQCGQQTRAGASLRYVAETGTGCGWFTTTAGVGLLLTDDVTLICVSGWIVIPVFCGGGVTAVVGALGGVRTGKGSLWVVTASP